MPRVDQALRELADLCGHDSTYWEILLRVGKFYESVDIEKVYQEVVRGSE
jgi:hypothetical protein